MTEANLDHAVETEPVDDLEALRRQAAALQVKAQTATRTYNRSTWIRFAATFFPVPFVVVLFRLHLEAWGYYLAGALIITLGALMVAMDGTAAAKRNAATEAAERAHQAYKQARRQPRSGAAIP
jgi:ABC-type protease/lipase transport system fused ATPase/permease subunit